MSIQTESNGKENTFTCSQPSAPSAPASREVFLLEACVRLPTPLGRLSEMAIAMGKDYNPGRN